MKDQSRKSNRDLQTQSPRHPAADELDAAGRSLSEALKISFVILKIIMVVLVGLFVFSGFKTVGLGELALVLRFGKIHGLGEDRLLKPGLHWVLPYPIEEIIRIPTEKMIDLPIDSFWYYQSPAEISRGPKDTTRPGPTLNPISDGYCITRSEKRSQTTSNSTGSDYNIVHCKWLLTYQIDKPEIFFKRVYVDDEDVKPGEIYFNVIKESITPLLKNMFDSAVVTTMVNYTIDDVLTSSSKIPDSVGTLMQEKLDRIESGIVVNVKLDRSTWPRQVNNAFQALMSASQESKGAISQAKSDAKVTLNEAASRAQEKISEAGAYRMKVIETARANAEYLQKLLPEYRKRPRLVLQRIYLDAIEDILNNADEKMIIQPTKDAKGTELWIYINRDPKLKPKSEEEQSP
ncbi:MAG: protease modulator HflK [Planctomycetota bacterium]|jgi:membrane protease subunit HflK